MIPIKEFFVLLLCLVSWNCWFWFIVEEFCEAFCVRKYFANDFYVVFDKLLQDTVTVYTHVSHDFLRSKFQPNIRGLQHTWYKLCVYKQLAQDRPKPTGTPTISNSERSQLRSQKIAWYMNIYSIIPRCFSNHVLFSFNFSIHVHFYIYSFFICVLFGFFHCPFIV